MDEAIYIYWQYLIKEKKESDWKSKYFVKEILDTDVREEILYWRQEVKNAESIEEVKPKLH